MLNQLLNRKVSVIAAPTSKASRGGRARRRDAWKLIENQNWEALRALLLNKSTRIHPTKKRFIKEAETKLPLFSFGIWQGAPLDVLQVMTKIDPACLTATDSQGRIPLHIACLRGYSADLVDFLLRRVHLCASRCDSQGNLPLHFAVQCAAAAEEEQEKRRSDPDSYCCSMRDDEEELQRQRWQEQREERLDILMSLLVEMPGAVTAQNFHCETPIDVAQRHLSRGHFGGGGGRKLLSTMLQNAMVLLGAICFPAAALSHTDVTVSCGSSFADLSSHLSSHNDVPTSAGYASPATMMNSSSHFMVHDSCCFDSMEPDFGEMESIEFQATGMRPPRRNACPNILALVIDEEAPSVSRQRSSLKKQMRESSMSLRRQLLRESRSSSSSSLRLLSLRR